MKHAEQGFRPSGFTIIEWLVINQVGPSRSAVESRLDFDIVRYP
jgi:hypothetical protein